MVEADRVDLSSYLTGATDSCPQIDVAAAASYQTEVEQPVQVSTSSVVQPNEVPHADMVVQ